MTVRKLITELLNAPDLEMEVKLYCLIDMEKINTELSEFEFISDDIQDIDIQESQDIVYIDSSF